MTSGLHPAAFLLIASQGSADVTACHGLKSTASTGDLNLAWTTSAHMTRLVDQEGVPCGFADFGALRSPVVVTTNAGADSDSLRINDELMKIGARSVVTWNTGCVSIRGSATGLCRVYYAETAEQGLLASDRADVLASRIFAPIDPTGVAVHLMEPVGHPFDLQPLWHGVHPVPPGSMLRVNSRCGTEIVPWWSPPEPSSTVNEASQLVRSALDQSVIDAGRDHHIVLTDLSGGLDSTSVTALSLRLLADSRIVAVTSADRGRNEDQAWAKRAARELGLADHLILGADDLPLVYTEIGEHSADTDHPSPALATVATIRSLAMIGRNLGATTHLTGHGGDHLFYGMPTLLRDSLRMRPVRSLRKINAYRHMFGWPLNEVRRQLNSRDSFGEWFSTCMEPGRVPIDRYPILTWGMPQGVPPWLSDLGRGLIDELIVKMSPTVKPLAPLPGRHAELDIIRQGAQLARAMMQISSRHGLAMQTPFFDDRVLAAVLTIAPDERVDPWSYKPLLKHVMGTILPRSTYARTSKDEGSLDLELGVRRSRPYFAKLLTDSLLADLGLVDVDHLDRVLAVESHPSMSAGGMTATMCTETWLRSQEGDR